ncbi:MAG TPA: hypothetical protein VF443_14870 [Nitrospira sp.]
MAVAAVLFAPNYVFLDADANPIAGGKLFTYEAGLSTPLATYSDASLTTPNTNPIILNSSGFSDTMIFSLDQAYKVDLFDANDVQVPGWPRDTYGVAAPDF